MKVDKWVTVIDGAGIERRVRRVDAREIEEGKARRAGEAKAEAPKEVEPLVEVDDQSVAPKAAKKK